VAALRWLWEILATVVITALVSGYVAHGSRETQMAVYVAASWPIYVFTYLWMKLDAQRRSTQAPPGATPLIAAVAPLAVSYYLISTRRRWHKLSSIMLLCLYAWCLLWVVALGEKLGSRLAS
jgi:hypothetical protein